MWKNHSNSLIKLRF